MLDEHEKEKMQHKIEICYALVRGLVFLKYRVFCVPAEWQGVEVGSSYKTNDSARLFTHFMVFTNRKSLHLTGTDCLQTDIII